MTDEQKWELIMENDRLWWYFCSKYGCPQNDPIFEDLLQETRLMVYKALDWYDPSKSKLATYMSQYLVHQIPQMKERLSSDFYLSRPVIDAMRILRAGGSEKDCREKGVGPEAINLARSIYQGVKSLDYALTDEDDGDRHTTLGDIVPDTRIIPYEDQFEEKLNEDLLYQMIEDVGNRLRGSGFASGERNAQVWFEFIYSRLYDIPLRQKDIGKKYGISQSYASRVYNRGLKYLREKLIREGIITPTDYKEKVQYHHRRTVSEEG